MSDIWGTNNTETLTGSAGDDNLGSGGGNDTLYGGAGNDTIFGYSGSGWTDKWHTVIYGGDGNDTIYASAGDDHILGDAGDDTINSGDGANTVDGGTGNDLIYASAGNDCISGGDGDDTINSGDGVNIVDGGAGNDIIISGDGANTIDGGADNDVIHAGAGANTINGGNGNDVIHAGTELGTGANVINGDAGNDKVYSSAGDDRIYGGVGDDIINAGDGKNTIDGGIGNDLMTGGHGNDYFIVRDAHDQVYDLGGVDSGIIYVDFYKPSNSVENWTWAPGVQRLPYWIDSLLQSDAPSIPGFLGSDRTIYFAFPAAAPAHFTAKDATGFLPFNEQQKSFARQALSYISSVIDVKFIETTDATGLNTIAFANNKQDASAGYAYYPGPTASNSDLLLDNDGLGNLSPRDGEPSALVLIHELGHALGLKHPFSHANANGDTGEGPYLSGPEETTQWTVLSYTMRFEDYHLRYSPFDIAALQYLYGPSKARSTNDVYTLNSDSTNFLWDGGGTDTVDGSSIAQDICLNLRPGYWGYIGSKSSLISAAGQITVNLGTTIENANGGSGNDTITGNEASNRLCGNDGNDVLCGGASNDVLDGGKGIDTASFNGNRSTFTITRTSSGYQIAGDKVTEGTDSLTSIERLAFTDSNTALDIDGIAGQAYRLYQAAFHRTPDKAGLGTWIGLMDKGMSLQEVSSYFQRSDEFRSLYGDSVTNKAFVDLLYTNVLGRTPDAQGYATWQGVLDNGSWTREQVLIGFSESTENQLKVIGSISNGIDFIPSA